MKFYSLIFCLLPLGLHADDTKSSKDDLKGKLGDLLKKIDKDGDGKLNDEEKEAIHSRAKKEILTRYDKDGDGKLSDEEKAKAKADGNNLIKKDKDGKDSESTAKIKAQLAKRYDKDGDGKLDEDEKKAATEAFKKLKDKAKEEKSGSNSSKESESKDPEKK